MRLWSLSPKYLDCQGLLAVWREGLLAKKVLKGDTKGYKKHPQLDRFRKSGDALVYIDFYLFEIYQEAKNRGYKFSEDKIGNLKILNKKIKVNSGQVDYEFSHLLKKLKARDIKRYREVRGIKKAEVNNLFKVVEGDIEDWEKVK